LADYPPMLIVKWPIPIIGKLANNRRYLCIVCCWYFIY